MNREEEVGYLCFEQRRRGGIFMFLTEKKRRLIYSVDNLDKEEEEGHLQLENCRVEEYYYLHF